MLSSLLFVALALQAFSSLLAVAAQLRITVDTSHKYWRADGFGVSTTFQRAQQYMGNMASHQRTEQRS
jgi:hypothetical protein